MAERRTMTVQEAAKVRPRRTMTPEDARQEMGVRTRQPAREQTREMLGIDPTIERGTLLPLGRTESGELIMALPEALVGVLESLQLPGQAMAPATTGAEPVDISERDVTQMALDVSPARTIGTRPGLGRYIREMPEARAIRETSSELLREAGQRNLRVKPEAQERFVRDARKALTQEGVRSSKVNPRAVGTLELWENDASQGVAWDLQDLLNKRKEAGIVAGTLDPSESRAGVRLKQLTDDFVDSLGPDDLEGGTAAGVPELLKGYRALWQRQAKVNELDEMFARAEEGKTGLENSLRNEFNKLLRSKKRSRGWSASELAEMRDITRGDTIQKALRFLSNFGPPAQGANRFLGTMFGIGGGGGLGAYFFPEAGPSAAMAGAAALTGTGNIAGRLAAGRAGQRTRALQARTATGGQRPMSTMEGIARTLAGPTAGAFIEPETGPGYF